MRGEANAHSITPARGILWARPCPRPAFVPVSRPRGSKAAGLRYERAFAKFLSPLGCIHGQWFEYEDETGTRYCQPDLLFPLSLRLMAIIEVKYTLVDRAFDQLLDIYKPVVEAAYNIPVGLVSVFKNMPTTAGNGHLLLHETIPEAVQWSRDTEGVGLIQWMGQPVVPKSNPRLLNVLKHVKEKHAA